MPSSNKNGANFFYTILAIYILYPLVYYYGVHLRDDYVFINAFDSITNFLWAIIGALTIFSIFRSIWLVSRNKTSNKLAFFKFPLLSLVLFILFWVYSFVPTYIDYYLN